MFFTNYLIHTASQSAIQPAFLPVNHKCSQWWMTIHNHNADLIMGHSLRRWPNIKTALGYCIMFARDFTHVLSQLDIKLTFWARLTKSAQNIFTTFVECWTNVEDVEPTLYTCNVNVLCLYVHKTHVLSLSDDVHYSHVLSQANPVNTKQLYAICTMLDQRRRRLIDVEQVLYNTLYLLGMQYIILTFWVRLMLHNYTHVRFESR